MLKLIQVGNQLSTQWPLAGEDTFEPGMIAQLKVVGNEIVCGVSDGTAPLGIIDDIRSTSFSSPVRDEEHIVAATGIASGSNYVTTVDVKQELDFPNIMATSFRVNEGPAVSLNPVNGVITFPAGSILNYDSDGDGTNDSFRIVVSYYYRIAEVPGDDSTAGTNRITVWFMRGLFETDQYDMNSQYYLNSPLYVGLDGKLTANQPTENHPAVAQCTGPPQALVNTLQFIWF